MSNKVWQVMPKVKLDYNLKFPNLSWITLQLLYNRGIKEEEAINIFLNPEFNRDLNDPFIFKDMAKVVDLIIKHIKNENLIIIYGDYDADGVTASALLYEVLSTLKAKCEIYIPDRVSEGYGLNKEAIEEIAKMGAKLIITVDGGIRNKEEVEYGLKKDLEIIITDHHVPPEKAEDLPACLILNPLADVDYPNKKLAGVGVAFKLAQAIITKAKLDDEIKNKLVDKVLDLVAIGTVADCVSLTGENRIFVKLGLEILNKTNRLGLQELIKVAKINNNKDLDTWNIGWQIGPRLNAAGRMEHANSAFELLITRNVDEAKAIARRLNDKNNERQKITNQIAEEIEQEISKKDDLKIIIAINKKEQGWPEGIIGLVAGRICEKYYLPTLVITKTEEGYKGSGRSIPEFNIVEAILKNSKYLEKYGGIRLLAGLA
ncbi:MAG: single-stranded-DNA-specific exonuclease RecJ [Patescibacteria group bacterium]